MPQLVVEAADAGGGTVTTGGGTAEVETARCDGDGGACGEEKEVKAKGAWVDAAAAMLAEGWVELETAPMAIAGTWWVAKEEGILAALALELLPAKEEEARVLTGDWRRGAGGRSSGVERRGC
jgi:hypothetical protein